MHLSQVNETLSHRICGGSEYMWDCWPNARFVDYSSEYATAGVIMNAQTQEIYEATVESRPGDTELGPYRWLNPAYKDAMYAEAESRGVDRDQAWDEVKWIDLEVEADYLEKAEAMFNNEEFDTRIQIEIDIDDELFCALAKEAHRRDMTFNDLCMEAIANFIEKTEFELAEAAKIEVFTVTVEDAADGSGDGIIQLPDTFIKQEDWREGDVLDWEVEDGQAILRNLSKQEREDGTTS